MYHTAELLVHLVVKDLSLDASPEVNAARALATLLRMLLTEQQEKIKKEVSIEYSEQLLTQIAALHHK